MPGKKEQPPNDNRTLHRYITSHNDDGKAIFSDSVPHEAPSREVMGGEMAFSLMYTNPSFPVDMTNDKDISVYKDYLTTPPAITIPGGSVCRVCDFPPGYLTPMHRTQSLDFGVVLEGEVELVLDSGETRLLKKGDVAVQRGTNHAWKSVTPDEIVDGKPVPKWSRMFFVLQTANPVEVKGRSLTEDEGGID